MFQMRVLQIAAGMNARFDERMAERNRVATELHDTILQTVQATKMIADNARYGHSADPAHLRDTIENISDWLARATAEGRAALNNLRASTTQRNDLAGALQQAAQTSGVISSMRFVLSVEGAAQDLHPIIRDEIYRIGTEAIRNAHLHSAATELEVNINYSHDLTVRVHDNGRGIDPDFTTSGKPGHFGLPGMQERATRIHGTLQIMSGPSSGTKVELVIPGKIAFRRQLNGQRSLYARLYDASYGRIVFHKRPDPKTEKEKLND
jgi:signal transduction histidine kinase